MSVSTSSVAVLGTGPIGLGSAALLLSLGHDVVAWSPRGTLPPGPINIKAEKALEHEATINITATCADAVLGAEVVLVTVPATGYRTTLDELAACLQSGQVVLMSGHLSFGALYLSRLLSRRGLIVPIAAWGSTVVSGCRLAPHHVQLSSVRAEVDMAAVPRSSGEAMLKLCCNLFGDRFRLREGLIAVALSNANPQNHLAIALCNFTRMEKEELWKQWANTTKAVSRLMEALDLERLAIAEACDVEVRSLKHHLSLSFHIREGLISEMVSQLAEGLDDPMAPAKLDTRYVLEDAPFGLYPTVLLGRISGRPAPLHEAGLRMLSALYGRTLEAENDILTPLKLETMNLAELKLAAEHGWLEKLERL